MSERNLTKEQAAKLQEIIRKWMEEVEQFFDKHKNDKRIPNQLDGSNTWSLVRIEQKYKRMINEELKMDFYTDIGEVEKGKYREYTKEPLHLTIPEYLISQQYQKKN